MAVSSIHNQKFCSVIKPSSRVPKLSIHGGKSLDQLFLDADMFVSQGICFPHLPTLGTRLDCAAALLITLPPLWLEGDRRV